MTRARLPRLSEVEAAARDPRLLRARAANPHDPAWRARGRCTDKQVDSELFFPLPTEPHEFALAICRRCDVRPECLAAALNAGDCEGVWGATTPRERRAMLIAWRNTSGPVPETEARPDPLPAAEEWPAFCAANDHEQNEQTRGIGRDGRPYCRTCQGAAGRKGSAARHKRAAAARAQRIESGMQQVAS